MTSARGRGADSGFSLIEVLMVAAVGATMLGMSVPLYLSFAEKAALNRLANQVEQELQRARLTAVNNNRAVRVRLNCPSPGYMRTVEVLDSAEDAPTNRCSLSLYPFPPDLDAMTRPNYDGPLQTLPAGSTIPTLSFEFQSDGSVYTVGTGQPQFILSPVTITVTRTSKTKAVTINGAGKVDQR